MAFIYCIYNDINTKLYIGKTYYDIQKRFTEHCEDSKSRIREHRPLYAAMRKYGLDKFHVKLIEETDTPEEREKYWISYYNSYETGYNATLGGDGSPRINRKQLMQLWGDGYNCSQISQILRCDADYVSTLLKLAGITKAEIISRGLDQHRVSVCKLNSQGEILNTYDSMASAARELIKDGISHSSVTTTATHIRAVCLGDRHTCCGYRWKFNTSL